ncbi:MULTISPECIES: AraC family transcriptional regulator [Vibrio]|nr:MULTISPECIES: AraC family transcriptional regulator [Vibrio]MBD1575938.1 AraC family transcriptional regulator [Vibrio sp. S11_S32]
MNHSIRAASLEGFSDLVRSYHANPNQILKEAGIVTSQLRDPDAFIYYEHFLAALELAAQHCQCDTFGLELSTKQGVNTLGLIGAYMSRQANIVDALTVARKYMYLHVEGLSLAVENSNSKSCEIQFLNLAPNELSPQKAQVTLGTCFCILRDLVGPTWRINKVSFRQDAPKNQEVFRDLFGCQPEFNSATDTIYFQSQFLSLKPNINNQLLDKMLFEEIESTKPNSQLEQLQRIDNAIKTLLATGDCTKENIALCMGLHPKKLQRFLAEQKTTYREMIDQVRKREALILLKNHQFNLTTVALKLGYCELSVFSRRFKIWFGMSPTQWQSRM